MRKRYLLFLLLCGITASFLEVYFITSPGTMDACYYFTGGKNLAEGRGLTENFLWNYLDDPSGFPHPSFTYWMPLSSLVAAVGMTPGQAGFRQAQIPFFILSSFFPLFVYWLGYRWTESNRIAVLAALFSIFSGFYTVYWLNVESFLIYAWIGGLILAYIPLLLKKEGPEIPFLVGMICGFAHLARADGILFLVLITFGILFSRNQSIKRRVSAMLVILAGYICISGFWYFRNLSVYGSLFPPGGLRTLWITSYNDLFHFPGADLTLERFLSAGLGGLLATRWEAFLWNFQTAIFVLGLVFLFPFILIGTYQLRWQPAIRFGIVYVCVLFFLMTVIYPMQGSRGGFFHSTTAMLTAVSITAAVGLDRVVEWMGQKRKWNLSAARWILLSGIVVFSLLASVWIYKNRVIGRDISNPDWPADGIDYTKFIMIVDSESVRIMVNNPPCFTMQTGIESVAIPDGDINTLLKVGEKFHITHLLLDSNAPIDLLPYLTEEKIDPRLEKKAVISEGENRFVVFQLHPQNPISEKP